MERNFEDGVLGRVWNQSHFGSETWGEEMWKVGILTLSPEIQRRSTGFLWENNEL